MKPLAMLLFCLLCQIQSVSAQSISLNHEGEKIIIYDDGSWRYYDDSDPDDLALFKESVFYKEDVKTKKKKGAKTKKAKVAKAPKAKKNKKSKTKVAKVPKQKKSEKKKSKVAKAPKVKSNKNKNTKVAKASKPKSPKSPKKKSKRGKKSSYAKQSKKNKGKTRSESIEDADLSTSSRDFGLVIRKKIIDIRDKQNLALEKERVANYATSKYERELKIATKRKLSKTKIKKIEAKYLEAKLQLKLARNQNKVLLKQRRAYEELQKKSSGAKAKGYAKLARKYNKGFEHESSFDREELVAGERKNKAKKQSKVKSPKKSGVRIPTDERVMNTADGMDSVSGPSGYSVSYPSVRPNAAKAAIPNCEIAFRGKDSFSGKKRLDLAPSKFFSFTSKKMRSYFEEGDMVTCNAYLSSVSGGLKFLCIEVVVASETSQKSYGSLEKQGLFSIRLVDGTNINLYNNKTDYGFMDPLKKTVLYKAQYLLPNEHIKSLSRVDIDKVRLVWSTGYEDYSIYETDFLINQLNCLEQ